MRVTVYSEHLTIKERVVAENKTKPNKQSVAAFMNAIEDVEKRRDAKKVAAMMREATGSRARMWGSSIVGFGEYHYQYDSGREGDSMITGFSPRKEALAVYIIPGFQPFAPLMAKLGQYKTGKSCLYIKRLSDVDETILNRLISDSVKHVRTKYGTK